LLPAGGIAMVASPRLGGLIGVGSTLGLITLVTGTSLVPLTAPLFAYVFFGAALPLSPLTLGLKLFALLAGSLFAGAALRWIIGIAVIWGAKQAIDGRHNLFMLVFLTAVRGGGAGRFLCDPFDVVGLALFAFAVYFTLLGLTTLIFRSIGYEHALSLGLVVSQRNLGLMLAATEGVLPQLTWLYFALCQFPIYLSPQLLNQLARKKVEARFARSDSDI